VLNEFRQDPVSGDWVIFSTARAKKPEPSSHKEKFYQSQDLCPFEGDFKNQGETLALFYQGKAVAEGSEWTTRVIKNKFPLVADGLCSPVYIQGLFNIGAGTGSHELVITKEHDRHFAEFSNEETAEVIQAYHQRFTELSSDPCSEYISIFHNRGTLAGASVYHSHSQIVSMPIVPSLIQRSLDRAIAYAKEHGSHIYDTLMAFELEQEKRLIAQNEKFVAFCPFASRAPYEIRIFPKTKQPSFGSLAETDILPLAEVLNVSLKKLHGLNDLDYIFFIRTTPLKNNDEAYCWHIEIMPRLSVLAGLELGTSVLVNTVDPDEAAATLKTL
jgi:UDPglucose--hexose-1-phosphate uridylyltransferase